MMAASDGIQWANEWNQALDFELNAQLDELSPVNWNIP